MPSEQARLNLDRAALAGAALLAPMSGVTDRGFRRVAAEFGATLVVSEMVAADQLAAGEEEARLRAEAQGVGFHVVQLAGCEAHGMAEGARVAEAAGADLIDINMGCPAKRVINGWSGSALMRDLDHALRLVDAVVGAVKVPVSLKMRLGWDETRLNAPELAARAEDAGIRLVTVHGRTRMQFYKGQANWNAVAPVRAATRLPLVVNGDIAEISGAKAALAASGADAVMVGRAALGRPWLVGEIAAGLQGRGWERPTPEQMAAAALAHYEALLDDFGVHQGVRHARKHVAAYADEAARLGAEIQPRERADALQAGAPEHVKQFLAAIFSRISDAGQAVRAA